VRRLIAALAVLVVLIVAAVVVVETAGRGIAENYIRGQVIKALPGTNPTVKIGSGSLVLQLLHGSLTSVNVAIPDATFGTFTGDLTLAARDVPLDSTKPIKKLDVAVAVDQSQLQSIVRKVKGLSSASVAVDNDVKISSSFTVFGLGVPYGISFAPSVSKSELVLTPTAVSVNKVSVSLSKLESSPLGAAVKNIAKPQKVCVAGYLPKVLSLSRVTIVGSTTRFSAKGNGIALGTTNFQKLGSCG